MTGWHHLTIAETLDRLDVDASVGLTSTEAAHRIKRTGRNELPAGKGRSVWRILRDQLLAVLVLVLIAAACISMAMGDVGNAWAIIAIVALFVLLGFVQEYRAERAMAALKRMAVPIVRVRRDGIELEIEAAELVPGDIVLLETGNLVPADCRIFESANLHCRESALTGESEPVAKETAPLEEGKALPLGDRRNMVYMGTMVNHGRGCAVVTATGLNTELGRIAGMLQSVEEGMTPLQKRLDHLGRVLAAVSVAIAAVIFGIGVLRGEELRLMFMTAVSLAVAAVPEGLPAVVTITLALGAQRMLSRHALIRRLPAVETLGAVTVICSDKTGTLTTNRMSVAMLDTAGHVLEISGEQRGEHLVDLASGGTADLSASLRLLLMAGTLCNDARLRTDDVPGHLHAIGDPTEGALLASACRYGIDRSTLERFLPRTAEIPFDSIRKRMLTVHQFALPAEQLPPELCLPGLFPGGEQGGLACVKGAVESVLPLCSGYVMDGVLEPLDAVSRERIVSAAAAMAKRGMRVIAVAIRPLGAFELTEEIAFVENRLIHVGLAGITDPPRPEVRKAVAGSISAGIRSVMITGDHPLTAVAVARELGIGSDGKVLTGLELDRMSVAELREVVGGVAVYARVAPEHKLKIVEALQANGEIVAMTGDGVNDAPALKRADIGVAMGLTGTDVAKEAADMVLRDDNFATIVAAVEEGRVIYDNIRKFVKFSIAGNIGKILVVLVGPFLGMPLPLLPLQILWLNLLTDGLLGLGIGVEPAERQIMHRPPYPPGESIFARGTGGHMLRVGIMTGVVPLVLGYWQWQGGNGSWQTLVFTSLALAQVGQVLAIRSRRDSFFSVPPWSNLPLFSLAVSVVCLQLAVVYLPALQSIFVTAPLSFNELLLCAAASSLVFWGIELEKWLGRRRHSVSG